MELMNEPTKILLEELPEKFFAFDFMIDAKKSRLCVRLVFCLYAEYAGIFDKRKIFQDYLQSKKIFVVLELIYFPFSILHKKSRPVSRRRIKNFSVH